MTQVNGGLFQAGDCHGTQGDSEYDGVAPIQIAQMHDPATAVLPAAGVQCASHAAIPLLLTNLRFH
jgi:acetamidase/formamidase